MRNAQQRLGARRREDRGAVAVEFALVIIPVIMLMFGIITGGMAYFQKISLADAAREGARFGATVESSGGWEGAVRDRTVNAATGTLDPANVCVEGPGGGSCEAGPSNPPATSDGVCFVRVRAVIPDVTLSIGVKSWEFDLVQDSYARYERGCS